LFSFLKRIREWSEICDHCHQHKRHIPGCPNDPHTEAMRSLHEVKNRQYSAEPDDV
jgi:hypothetical protein